MKPEDMNTINADGKAYNGNWRAVSLAVGVIALAAAVLVFNGGAAVIGALFG